jgi:hypothetical protein
MAPLLPPLPRFQREKISNCVFVWVCVCVCVWERERERENGSYQIAEPSAPQHSSHAATPIRIQPTTAGDPHHDELRERIRVESAGNDVFSLARYAAIRDPASLSRPDPTRPDPTRVDPGPRMLRSSVFFFVFCGEISQLGDSFFQK